MRVIRTEMYFSEVRAIAAGANRLARENPGIGVAYFGGRVLDFEQIGSLLAEPRPIRRRDDSSIGRFLDLSLRGTERSFRSPSSKYLKGEIKSADIVDFLYEANIVVEESPPVWESFKSLVSKSPGIGIGTYVGMELAGSNPQLMIITVPMGIVVVSSAIGISKALEKGLNQKVEQMFKQRV
jgi:hypothetical protein